MTHKAIPGVPLVVKAGEYNAAMEAGEWFRRQKQLGSATPGHAPPVNPCEIKAQNNSGGALTAGSVVEAQSSILTTLDREHIWLAGTQRSGNDPSLAIVTEDTPSGDIGRAQASGVCLASVDIQDVDNTHARFISGSNTLKGDFGGPIELMIPPSGTGVQTLPVKLGPRSTIIRRAKAEADIASGASGTVGVYINGSKRGTVTAYNDWDAGNVSNTDELRILYLHDQDKWEILKRGGGAATHPCVFQDVYSMPAMTTTVGIGTSPSYYTLGYYETLGSRTDNHVARIDLGGSGDPCFSVSQTGAYRITMQVGVTFSGNASLDDTITTSGASAGTAHTHTVAVYQAKQAFAGWLSYLERRVGGSGGWTYLSATLGRQVGVYFYQAGGDSPVVTMSHEFYINLTSGWQLRHIVAPDPAICNSDHRLDLDNAKLLIHYMGASLTADTT